MPELVSASSTTDHDDPDKRDDVLAFCQARSAEGGSGALIVLLNAARRRPR